MNDRELAEKVFNSVSKKEKEYADMVSYVILKMFPVSKRVKINKSSLFQYIREYLIYKNQ